MAEYRTERFTNDPAGLREKDSFSQRMADDGWRISSESVEPGHMKGGQACCLASCCLPLGFAAGRTSGSLVVTFTRNTESKSNGQRFNKPATRSVAGEIGWALGRAFAPSNNNDSRGPASNRPEAKTSRQNYCDCCDIEFDRVLSTCPYCKRPIPNLGLSSWAAPNESHESGKPSPNSVPAATKAKLESDNPTHGAIREERLIYCGSCGQSLTGDSVFCRYCGKEITRTVNPGHPPTPPPSQGGNPS